MLLNQRSTHQEVVSWGLGEGWTKQMDIIRKKGRVVLKMYSEVLWTETR